MVFREYWTIKGRIRFKTLNFFTLFKGTNATVTAVKYGAKLWTWGLWNPKKSLPQTRIWGEFLDMDRIWLIFEFLDIYPDHISNPRNGYISIPYIRHLDIYPGYISKRYISYPSLQFLLFICFCIKYFMTQV